MKKILGIVGLSVALLGGCGSSEEPKPNENNNPTQENTNTATNQNQNNNQPDGNTDIDSNTEPEKTTCPDGFTGENCDQCADSRFAGEKCDQCASGYYGENCEKENGFLPDPRDENLYKTVKINDQIWMAQNLRYSNVEHYSADDNSSNETKYGFLYTYENAMKACPSGWRLPNADELLALIGATEYGQSVSTTTLQDKSWVSTASNSTGFSAMPAGYYWFSGYFDNFDLGAYYWSATQDEDVYVYALSVNSDSADVGNYNSNNAFSVRCIQDSN